MATKLCPLRNNKYGSSQDCNEIFCMLWDKEEENCLISSALIINKLLMQFLW